MSTRSPGRPGFLRVSGRIFAWSTVLVVLVAVMLLAGLGVVVVLDRSVADDSWSRWGNVGETFGAMNTVFSGLALAAVVVTFWIQFHELRTQHDELITQRETLARSQEALHRTAEVNLRMLHMRLLTFAMDDADLAAVWPPMVRGLPHEQNRQYIYANMIFQHLQLSSSIGPYTEARIEATLRHLFSSPLMREYWAVATHGRSFITADSPEFDFTLMADKICREYENVCANSQGEATRRRGSSHPRWDDLDADPTAAAA